MGARFIATIGYQGLLVDDFALTLGRAGVNCLLDIRAVPVSRKRGFSKNQLKSTLLFHGIEYVHLAGLGDPKQGRIAARGGDYLLFEKIYRAHLESETAIAAMNIAAKIIKTKSACLMCFESDHRYCHRSIVADRLQEVTGSRIINLLSRDPK